MSTEQTNAPVRFSIVVPFHNEEENVTELYDRLKNVMETTGETFEMVFVDDGRYVHSSEVFPTPSDDGIALYSTGGTANFTNVTAYGAAGNGPSYFIVQGKDGLYYEYGNTADSKAYANAGTTPYAWMLNKVRDRQTQADNLIVTYSTTSGAVTPFWRRPATSVVVFQ